MSRKSPSYTKQLGLAVVLCALGGTAYWLEYARKPKEEQKKADEKKVLSLRESPVQGFELKGKGEAGTLNVALECQSLKDGFCRSDDHSKWTMTSPLKARADDAATNSVLKNFGNLVASEVIDLGGESPEKRQSLLKDYGLSAEQRNDPASKQITIRLTDGKTLRVTFGEKHPISESRFALLETAGQADENRVFVVPEWQLAIFNQKNAHFRDKKLFSVAESDVTELKLENPKKFPNALEIKKNDQGKWLLDLGPKEATADPEETSAFLSGVLNLSAIDFVADRKDSAEGKAALKGLKLRYRAVLKTGAEGGARTLTVFEKPPVKAESAAYYAIVDGQDPLYEIDPNAFQKLDKSLEDLRTKKLIATSDRYSFSTAVFQIHGRKGFTQTLNKEAGSWRIAGKEVAKNRMETILDRLSSNLVKGYSNASPEADLIRMDLKKGNDTLYALEFWQKKGKLYARDRLNAKGEAIEIAPDFASQLPWDERFLTEAP